jgi:hypothetical protein
VSNLLHGAQVPLCGRACLVAVAHESRVMKRRPRGVSDAVSHIAIAQLIAAIATCRPERCDEGAEQPLFLRFPQSWGRARQMYRRDALTTKPSTELRLPLRSRRLSLSLDCRASASGPLARARSRQECLSPSAVLSMKKGARIGWEICPC